MDKKVEKLRFIGYTDAPRNYRLWDEKSRANTTINTMLSSMNLTLKKTRTTAPKDIQGAGLKLEMEIPQQPEIC